MQDVVALSSTEAEYIAMGHAVQEGLYLQMLQIEMGIGTEEGGTLLLMDNQSTIKLVENLCFTRGVNILQLSITLLGRSWRVGSSHLSLSRPLKWLLISLRSM